MVLCRSTPADHLAHEVVGIFAGINQSTDGTVNTRLKSENSKISTGISNVFSSGKPMEVYTFMASPKMATKLPTPHPKPIVLVLSESASLPAA